MASGNTLLVFTPQAVEVGTSAVYAVPDLRNGHPVLNFDAGTAMEATFSSVMPRHYSGGGVRVIPHVASGTATSGTTVWTSAFERIGVVLDIDGDSFATGNLGTLTMPGTSGNLGTVGIVHTDGAQMDSVAVGEGFRLKLTRTVADAQDAMPGTAQLRFVEVVEV